MEEKSHHNVECFMAHMGIWSMEQMTFKQTSSIYLSGGITLANQGERSTGEMETKQLDSGILIVPISGVIMRKSSSFGGTSTVRLKKVLKDAMNDSSVKGILLHIDSPGGHTDGLFEAAQIIKEVNATKPIFSHVDGMMASAAFWLGSQVTKITASPMATIGSLGTLMTVTDFSEAFKKNGVKVHVLSTGEFKGMGEPGSEITKNQLAFLQRRVNEINKFFKDAVIEGRGFSQEKVDSLFDGSFELAATALEKGLIDEIKMFDESVAELETLVNKQESGEDDILPDEDDEVIDLGPLDDDSVARALSSDTMETEIKQNKSSNKEIEEMSDITTIAELKQKHTNLCAQIEESAKTSAYKESNEKHEQSVKAETKRVEGWLDFMDVDPKAVAEGIKSGEEISISQATTLAVARNDDNFKSALVEENPENVKVPDTETSKEEQDVSSILKTVENFN